MTEEPDWERYCRSLFRDEGLGFSLDLSRMSLPEDLAETLEPDIRRAWRDMRELEAGAVANPDEGRQVGHFWLRAPDLAPGEDGDWIERTRREVEEFADAVLKGSIAAPGGGRFRHLLLVGIGGSALGPQLLADALGQPGAGLDLRCLDNTDPAGMDRVFASLGTEALASTLVVVTSKSGGTPETRNGMLEARAAFEAAGLDFPSHAVAVTSPTRPGGTAPFRSTLHDRAMDESWLAVFEMADWIGGRVSLTSAAGMLPARLAGIDTAALLRGAASMDALTRRETAAANPAMLLALAWHHAGEGRGAKDMVILPYCDRLALLGKYLQQLVMESLGKALDRQGRQVNQGIAVYGNKGSTDQHAYVQQLRDGLNNFFATFIEIRQSRRGPSLAVDEAGMTSGDYLQGFLRGTREALWSNGRASITLSFDQLDAASFGALVALYERAVSFYASLVDINAYHQPGVEAGKKAGGEFLRGLARVAGLLSSCPGDALTAAEIREGLREEARGLGLEAIYHAASHLAASRPASYRATRGQRPAEDRFGAI